MKKIKTIIALTLVAAALGTSYTTADAEWKKDDYGWWNSEGDTWSVGWRNIDNSWYYFGSDGYMKTSWILDGGDWYYLNNDGSMKHSEWLEDKGAKYYLTDNGAMAKDTMIDGKVINSDGVYDQEETKIRKEDESIAEEYVKSKGYEVSQSYGQDESYVLHKELFCQGEKAVDYSFIWDSQDVKPDDYFGKEIRVYKFDVKNSLLEDERDKIRNVFAMVCENKIVGGYIILDRGLNHEIISIDNKKSSVREMGLVKWAKAWHKKYGTDESGNNNGYCDIGDLPEDYSYDEAKKNGDIVTAWCGSEDTVDKEKMDKFIENYKSGKAKDKDMIRIRCSDTEGGCDITDLIVTGEYITCIYEHSRDEYGAAEQAVMREYEIKDFIIEKDEYEENVLDYYAISTDGQKMDLFSYKEKSDAE